MRDLSSKIRIAASAVALILLLLAESLPALPGLFVQGRHLYDRCGEKVVLRGINGMNIWCDLPGNSFPEIAQTGANCVRIIFQKYGSTNTLNLFLTKCASNRMIPIIELHDATCQNLSQVSSLVDYWVRSDVLKVLQAHERHLIINIGNEVGGSGDFFSAYSAAVSRMRNAGIHVPLMIDASSCGQDINVLQQQGPGLTASDPDHNLLFSVHCWWPYSWGYSESTVRTEFEECVAMDLPFLVGEFSYQWDANPSGQIPYLSIITQCQKNDIGWLPWSWGPGNNPQTFLDMSPDGTYAGLTGHGLEMAVTHPYSIQNTAVRPWSMQCGTCSFGAVLSNVVMELRNEDVCPEVFLSWNPLSVSGPAVEYRIYCAGNPDSLINTNSAVLIGSTTGTAWTDRDLIPGKERFYRIRALTNSVFCGASLVGNIPVPFLKIRDFRFNQRDSPADIPVYWLSWTGLTNSGPVEYQVLEGEESGSFFMTYPVTEAGIWRISKPVYGQKRWYQVRSLTNGNAFALSDELPVEIPLPKGKTVIRGTFVRPERGDPDPVFLLKIPLNRTKVVINIYNSAGEYVATPVNETFDAGYPEPRTWDLKTSRGKPVPSGVYIIIIQRGGIVEKHQIMVAR